MVGEISNWPHGPSTHKSDWRLTALMIIIIVGVMGYILVVPDREDLGLLPQVAGCYLNREHRLAVIVDGRKLLRVEGLSVPVQIYDQKSGGALLLASRPIRYEWATNRLEAQDGYPSYIPSDRFFSTLEFLDDRGASILFARVPCPRPDVPLSHQ